MPPYSQPKTLYEKIWDAHLVHEEPGKPAIIYIDRHLIHEGTSPQAFSGLRKDGRKVRRPDLTFAVMDHSVPTTDRTLPIIDQDAVAQFDALEKNCGDSHTSTHGAFGTLAFGIGTSEVEHVLATQCLVQARSKKLHIRVEGSV